MMRVKSLCLQYKIESCHRDGMGDVAHYIQISDLIWS